MTDHPTYGTCLGCTQAKRVDKRGQIREHTRTMTGGNVLLTVTCKGSHGPYAEYSRVEWNPQLSKFVDMPIEVDAILHPVDGGQDEDVFVSIRHWPSTKAGHKVFVKQGMSLHLFPAGDTTRSYAPSFRAELRNADGTVVQTEEARNDGSIQGLVLGWMEALGRETASAKGGQS